MPRREPRLTGTLHLEAGPPWALKAGPPSELEAGPSSRDKRLLVLCSLLVRGAHESLPAHRALLRWLQLQAPSGEVPTWGLHPL